MIRKIIMNHLFIINPKAGKGKTLDYVDIIKNYFSGNNEKYIIEITKYPGHATKLVREYVSHDKYRVYAIGGDGTVNEVVNGLIGSNSILAVIPAGCGNDFFKSIQEISNDKDNYLSFNITEKSSKKDILDHMIKGIESQIDICKINEKYFANIASVGFDAEVTYKSNKIKNIPFISGLLAYSLSIFTMLFTYTWHPLKINIDDGNTVFTIEKNALLVAVANGKYYGGGMQPAPLAKIDDGFLDVCLIDYVGRLKILRFFPKFLKGKHGEIKEVSFQRCKKLSIYSKNNIAINIDGEAGITNGEINFEIIPSALKIVLPLQEIYTAPCKDSNKIPFLP